MIVLYATMFSIAVHNTTRFVLKDARGKNFHITYFYVMVYLIIIIRVTWLSLILNTVLNYASNHPTLEEMADDGESKSIFFLDLMATYMEMLCGLQQFISMFELYQMIKSASLLVNLRLTETRQTTLQSDRATLQQNLSERQDTI